MLFLAIFLICFICFLIGFIYLIQGPPYVPSNDKVVGQMITEIEKIKPKKIVEMGSGDGKLVIALAKKGFNVVGIELNPLLVLRSRKTIKKLHLENKATILWRNFWSFDTSSYDVLVIYLVTHVMPRLEKKLLKELHTGTYIFSNYCKFPTIKPISEDDRMKVYKV